MTDELGFDVDEVLEWFADEQAGDFLRVDVAVEVAESWLRSLQLLVRRCYLSDEKLTEIVQRLGLTEVAVIRARLPDPGAVMAGDFGEIVTYLHHAAKAHPNIAIGAKKWRLKEDRRKAAPHSDVVHFILPEWPEASARDVIVCSEVKTKSTAGRSAPITRAIEGSTKDRTSRLAATLAWLRERALFEDLGDVRIEHLDRFLHPSDFPASTRRFQAVSVICRSLIDGELATVPDPCPADTAVVVIVVPELHRIYNAVYTALSQEQA